MEMRTSYLKDAFTTNGEIMPWQNPFFLFVSINPSSLVHSVPSLLSNLNGLHSKRVRRRDGSLERRASGLQENRNGFP